MKLSLCMLVDLAAGEKKEREKIPNAPRNIEGSERFGGQTVWVRPWPNNFDEFEECSQSGTDQVVNTSEALSNKQGLISTINPSRDNISCQTTVQTNCDEVAFRIVDFDVLGYSFFRPRCGYDFIQIGNPAVSKTDKMCGNRYEDIYDDYYDSYGYEDQFPLEFFQWTRVDSSELTIAFHTGDYSWGPKSSWSVKWRCVEDLLPKCISTPSIFGTVNYFFHHDANYESTESESNLIERNVSENDCPKVTHNRM